MLLRIWRCVVEEGRAEEYEDFARRISLPMFRKQRGFRGCIMVRRGQECEVFTLWADESAIEMLARSDSYQSAVAGIRAAGLLADERGATVVRVHEAEFVDLAFRGRRSRRKERTRTDG